MLPHICSGIFRPITCYLIFAVEYSDQSHVTSYLQWNIPTNHMVPHICSGIFRPITWYLIFAVEYSDQSHVTSYLQWNIPTFAIGLCPLSVCQSIHHLLFQENISWKYQAKCDDIWW